MHQILNHANLKHSLPYSIFIISPIAAEALIIEDNAYKMKASQEETQFQMEF